MPIDMKPGEKAFFVASTGSGKTYLMRKLLLGGKYVIILDPKNEFSWSDTGTSRYDRVVYSVRDLHDKWKDSGPIIYRPDITDLHSRCDEFFNYVWHRKSVHVAIDELLDICPNGEPGFWLEKGIKQGRSRKLTIWSGTQRPFSIPLALMSESKHFFVGHLLMPQDRGRMASLVHPSLKTMMIPPFRFKYGKTGSDVLEDVSADDLVVERRNAK